jgi:hypothetical protein
MRQAVHSGLGVMQSATLQKCQLNVSPTRSDGEDRLVGLARFELAIP